MHGISQRNLRTTRLALPENCNSNIVDSKFVGLCDLMKTLLRMRKKAIREN